MELGEGRVPLDPEHEGTLAQGVLDCLFDGFGGHFGEGTGLFLAQHQQSGSLLSRLRQTQPQVIHVEDVLVREAVLGPERGEES